MRKSNVLVCYGKMNVELVKGYKYLIVESKHYLPSNIRVLKSQNEHVLAYMSLGEVNANAPHFSTLKKLTIGENKIWNSYYLNLNSKKTVETLLIMIDEIFAKGYEGLFLDNFDNFTIHGPQKDQKEAIVALMKTIKKKYPDKVFIQNSGLEFVEKTAKYIDAIAIESVATDYSFKNKTYNLRDKSQYEASRNRLLSLNKNFKIPVIVIEYADTDKLYDQILERINNSNFDFFIGNIDLQTIPKYKQ